jgi:hypothetical protein
MGGGLSAQDSGCHTMQFVIDESHEPVERFTIAAAPGFDEAICSLRVGGQSVRMIPLTLAIVIPNCAMELSPGAAVQSEATSPSEPEAIRLA